MEASCPQPAQFDAIPTIELSSLLANCRVFLVVDSLG
jgi:hypothetical protein